MDTTMRYLPNSSINSGVTSRWIHNMCTARASIKDRRIITRILTRSTCARRVGTSIPYFGIPSLDASGVPTRPGLERNAFRGPRYRDFDFTVLKEFGLPNMKVFGEGARISLRADFYNLFNTLNLSPISGYQNVGGLAFDSKTNATTVSGVNTSFGKATAALGARVI